MKKKIHVKLDGEEKIDEIFDAIILNNCIKYKENNINVVIEFNQNELNIKRSCNEYKINLNLKKGNSISTYQVFGNEKVFELETITKDINISNSLISVNYNLEGNDFSFVLEVI